ncbi:isopentenyl-diphosphate Delta-isomerase [Microbacterium sp. G2-8]|uniref:isopentenyl-diphosphate Delta-isomerase n=1 Tax=Microbacterium sp. G2-8 TaxID=2842454 RepID=UPI001C88F153|nr:isopentenyl-diphosphate Delta-isomerase [Microbacterium sp. G2-8]
MEHVVLVDDDGVAIGAHPKATVHGETTPRHLAFSCHVVRSDGHVLMTRRALGKRTWPGVWTNSYCGHPEPGESLEDAVRRRATFELGLDVEIVSCPLPEFGYTARDASGIEENEHCPVFVARAVSSLDPNPDEVSETQWISPDDLSTAVNTAPWAFSPWLVAHLPGVMPALSSDGARAHPVPLFSAFESRMAGILRDSREDAARFTPSYERLWETVAWIARGGKKVRPRLLLDAYRALGGDDDAAAVDAACAIELLHAALVIHDDVIDGDLTRRGRENVAGRFASEAQSAGAPRRDARAWGDASSIISGDLLLTRAHALIAGLDVAEDRRRSALDIFSETVFESAAGEHTDVLLSMHLTEATPDDVLAMIEHKTAAYSFRAPLALAAALSGAPRRVTDAVDVIARQIGVIYQLRDDVLGTFGDERETGKSVLSDLREGKETLLISYARADPAWSGIARHFGDEGLTPADGARVRDVVERSGARAYVESLIDERREEVGRRIRDADLPAGLVQLLEEANDACSARRA